MPPLIIYLNFIIFFLILPVHFYYPFFSSRDLLFQVFMVFFYNNNGLFNGVILLDFQNVFSIGVLFHSIDSHKRPCVLSLKGPYDPLL